MISLASWSASLSECSLSRSLRLPDVAEKFDFRIVASLSTYSSCPSLELRYTCVTLRFEAYQLCVADYVSGLLTDVRVTQDFGVEVSRQIRSTWLQHPTIIWRHYDMYGPNSSVINLGIMMTMYTRIPSITSAGSHAWHGHYRCASTSEYPNVD